MEKITLSINAHNVSCLPGTTILEAAEKNGIKIPTLCHHHDLEPVGACRICLVEDEQTGRLMASCVMPASPDMSILTDTERVRKHRRNIVRLMMAEHPESCLVCSKGNRCRLRELAAEMSLGQTGLYPMPNVRPLEQVNPFMSRDLSKCILCGKCIRADHELVWTGAIDYSFRGFKSRPYTLHDSALEDSGCTFCGTCISICPTGALAPNQTNYIGTPDREVPSICGFCGVGCSIDLGVTEQAVIETRPSRLKDSVNGATLCVRGHFANDFLDVKERLKQPMIRKDDARIAVSWDEALDRVSQRLLELKKDFGPQSIGFLGSSKCSNEENYVYQKIARTLLETHNVDNGGNLSGRSVISRIDARLGWSWRTRPLFNLENAEAVVVWGANPSHSAPVVSYYIKRAAKKGASLIVVDPVKTDLVPFSSVWLRLWPEKDVSLINSLAALLWKRFGHNMSFITRFTQGFDTYTEALSSFNWERLCVDAGAHVGTLQRIVGLLSGKRIAFLVGHGILQQKGGAGAMDALLNLALMTGSLGHDTGGLYVVSRENNEFGAWDMGTVPEALPGRKPLSDPSQRERFEKAWHARLSPDRGLNMIRMIEEAEKGNLKGLYIMGENPVRALPQRRRVMKALNNLEFLVVQDILETETTRIAQAVLPGAAFAEKEGSYTNMEGRIQRVPRAVLPPGDARADWKILIQLAKRLGYPNNLESIQDIRTEIGRLVPEYAEINKEKTWGWIRDAAQTGFDPLENRTRPVSFFSVSQEDNRGEDEDHPYAAVLGAKRYHLGSGTRTGYSLRIRSFGLNGEAGISPEDAKALNLENGDSVRIRSRFGAVVRRIRLDIRMPGGLISVPLGFNGNDAMELFPLMSFEDQRFPGLKMCPVAVERL